MSAILEMVANVIPPPAPRPGRRRGYSVGDRDRSYVPTDEWQDAAAVRARKVTMAAEPLAVARSRPTDENPDHVDILV